MFREQTPKLKNPQREKRTREAELKLTREKARVEEEERQLVRAQYDKRRRDEKDFREFLDFKKNIDTDLF